MQEKEVYNYMVRIRKSLLTSSSVWIFFFFKDNFVCSLADMMPGHTNCVVRCRFFWMCLIRSTRVRTNTEFPFFYKVDAFVINLFQECYSELYGPYNTGLFAWHTKYLDFFFSRQKSCRLDQHVTFDLKG